MCLTMYCFHCPHEVRYEGLTRLKTGMGVGVSWWRRLFIFVFTLCISSFSPQQYEQLFAFNERICIHVISATPGPRLHKISHVFHATDVCNLMAPACRLLHVEGLGIEVGGM